MRCPLSTVCPSVETDRYPADNANKVILVAEKYNTNNFR